MGEEKNWIKPFKENFRSVMSLMFHQTPQAGCSKGSNLLLSGGDILALRDESLRFNHFLNFYQWRGWGKNTSLGSGHMLEPAQTLCSLKASQMQLSPQMVNLIIISRTSCCSHDNSSSFIFSTRDDIGQLGHKKGSEKLPCFTVSIWMPAFGCILDLIIS